MGGVYRGLSVDEMDRMDLGEIVDLIITANNMSTEDEEETIRTATQADWDAM